MTIQLHTMSFGNHIDLQTMPMGAPEIYPSVTSHATAAGIWKSLYHRLGNGKSSGYYSHTDVT